MISKKIMVYKDLLTVLAITIIAVLLLIESILSKAWDGVFLIVFLSICFICNGLIKNKTILWIVRMVLFTIAIINLIYHKELFGR